jgi:hypothetical protein
MYILRIEHKKKIDKTSGHFAGAFMYGSRALTLYNEKNKSIHCPSDHPNPHEDGIKYIDANFVCGFINKEQLLLWFPLQEGRAEMKEGGFVLRKYKVDGRKIKKAITKSCLTVKIVK